MYKRCVSRAFRTHYENIKTIVPFSLLFRTGKKNEKTAPSSSVRKTIDLRGATNNPRFPPTKTRRDESICGKRGGGGPASLKTEQSIKKETRKKMGFSPRLSPPTGGVMRQLWNVKTVGSWFLKRIFTQIGFMKEKRGKPWFSYSKRASDRES